MELITLKNGPTLPDAVIRLAVDLEMRGFTLRADDKILVVSPPMGEDKNGTVRDSLSESDRETIKKYKQHLLAVLTYEPPPIS